MQRTTQSTRSSKTSLSAYSPNIIHSAKRSMVQFRGLGGEVRRNTPALTLADIALADLTESSPITMLNPIGEQIDQ